MLETRKYSVDILFSFLLIMFTALALMVPPTYAKETKRSLFDACKKGDIETVKRLIGDGLSVELRDDSNSSLLGIAMRKGHIELVKFLLDKGAEINAISSAGRTPLMQACGSGYFEIVKLLVEREADINLKNRQGETALYLASRRGSLEIVKLLLENGADMKVESRTGRTAFVVACISGHLQVAKILLDYDSSIRSQKNMLSETLIDLSTLKNAEEMLDFLIELGADINHSSGGQLGWNGLIQGAANGRKEFVQLLIKKGARVDATDNSGNTALLHAARNGKTEVMKTFLENGANPEHRNLKGETAILLAKNDEIVDFLKKYGAKAPIPLTLDNFDLLHALPYDKRLASGLEFAFKQYYRLLTNRPGLLVSVNTSSSKLDAEKYRLICTLKIKDITEKHEIILSNRAKDTGENLRTLGETIKKFSKKRRSEWKVFKHNRPSYDKFLDELAELLSHFDYMDIFGALQQIDQHLASGSFGPEVLLSASEIYSWLAFFKNRNQDRKLSDFLAVRAICYYILGCLGDVSEEHESFCKGLLLLALDYPAFAEKSFSGKLEIEKILKAYIRYDFNTLDKFNQKPLSNKRLLTYLTARSYNSSDQSNVAWSHYESLALNYPDFLIAKDYIIDNGSVGFSRNMIASYMEDLIEKHLAVLDKFTLTTWIEHEKNLDRLVKKEVPEDGRLEKWLKIHKAIVEGTKTLKRRTYLFDTDLMKKFLMGDMENALLIYYRLETVRLGRGAEATAIVDMVKTVYPDSALRKVLLLKEKKDRSGVEELLRKLSLDSADKFIIQTAIESKVISRSQSYNFLKAFSKKENPDSIGLYNIFKFHQDLFYRPVVIKCLDEGITADPYNCLFYEKIFSYEEGEGYLDKGKKSIGELYGFLTSSGKWYFDNGKIKEAVSCYQAAIERSPSQKTAYKELGEIYHKEKEYEKAIQTWKGYLKYDNNTLSAVDIKNTIGNAWIETGEISKAYDIFLESKKSWQEGALLGFAEASEKTGKTIQAEEYFKKVAHRYPAGKAPNLLGLFYLRQGNTDMAIQTFRQYKRYQQWHLYLYYLVDHFTERGTVEKALNIVKQVEKEISDKPRFSPYISTLAEAYAYKGFYDNAITLLEPFALKGEHTGYITQYLSYCKEGNSGDPEKVLSTYIKKNSWKPYTYWNLANSCLRSNLFDEALPLLLKLLNRKKSGLIDRLQKQSFLYAALCWRIVNGDQKTKEDIKSHLKDYAKDRWLLSTVSFLIGDIDEKTILEKARTQKQCAEIFYCLGFFRNNDGKRDDALKYLLFYLEVMDDRDILYTHAYKLAKELAQ